MDKEREDEIIRKVLAGDTQPFELLVREYQGPIYNLMLRSTADVNHAFDLAQETFVRAYTRLETFKIGKRFFSWLYALALNVARDWMRSSGRDFHVYMASPADMVRKDSLTASNSFAEDQIDGAKAFEMIMELAPKYREALILRFRYDLSMKEVGQALGISVSGAKMRISRGLAILRQDFEE